MHVDGIICGQGHASGAVETGGGVGRGVLSVTPNVQLGDLGYLHT